ncbi:hypothetical protein LW586_27450 (plasmid) [Klebsiella quasipneumoniae]|uniref:hypothetical protein n=1 Tax=Klebsiella pneumoniae complex TaxID=3390273 RepID=UPI001E4D4225|nr:hypothetical protein [Klebsiella quasipneumoniae]
MAHQTPSSSLKKHPRSLRLILAELFSGRVSARLSELEEKVGQMEHRLDDHAVAISNLGGSCGNGGSDEDPNRKNPARHLGRASQSNAHGELRWINFNEKDYFQWPTG